MKQHKGGYIVDKYTVGETLYIYNDLGGWSKAKLININGFREPDKKYVVEVENSLDLIFVGDNNIARNMKTVCDENGKEILVVSDSEIKIYSIQKSKGTITKYTDERIDSIPKSKERELEELYNSVVDRTTKQ